MDGGLAIERVIPGGREGRTAASSPSFFSKLSVWSGCGISAVLPTAPVFRGALQDGRDTEEAGGGIKIGGLRGKDGVLGETEGNGGENRDGVGNEGATYV